MAASQYSSPDFGTPNFEERVLKTEPDLPIRMKGYELNS